MDFEWDEHKNQTNIEKRGIDFRKASRLFKRKNYVSISPYELEIRLIVTGELDGDITSVIYTIRSGIIRIISARAAKKREIRLYRVWQEERS